MSEQGFSGLRLSDSARGVITIWLAQSPLPLCTDTVALAACARLAKAAADPMRHAAEIPGTTHA
jgi:hypothetical protein